MQINRVLAVYYSATGNTGKIVRTIAKNAASALDVPFKQFSYTLPSFRETHYTFLPDDLVFFATPVYAGRVPNKLLPFVESGFTGGGAVAVPITVFGNRNFDNGLIELRNLLEQNGFHTIAAAAFAATHAFSDAITGIRPDEADWQVIHGFTEAVVKKIRELTSIPDPIQVPGDNPPLKYYTPLGVDGQPTMFLKAKPQTHKDLCKACGICAANCPMAAISKEDPTQVPGTCIKCQACVRKCPHHAKYFDDPNFLSHVRMLEQNYTTRKEPRVFL